MDTIPQWVYTFGIVGAPAVLGVVSLLGAWHFLHVGRDNPKSSGRIAGVILSILGSMFLIAALGVGACFAMLSDLN